MEQEIYGDQGLDEVIDKPCKVEGCVGYEYEAGLCETHLEEEGLLDIHDCKKGQDSSCNVCGKEI